LDSIVGGTKPALHLTKTTGVAHNKANSTLSFSSNDQQDSKSDDRKPLRDPHETEDGRRRPLKLMDFTEIRWPHPIKFFRNYVFSALIRGYYDHSFSIGNFMRGAEQALVAVSGLISRGQFENLDGLVASEAHWELRRNYDRLSPHQRELVAINTRDIIVNFVYEIGMIFDDDTDQRFVEITTVFQGYYGLDEMKRRNPSSFVEEMYQHREQIYVCNYRFIREFTKGKEDEWIINKLNHFCPAEEARSEED